MAEAESECFRECFSKYKCHYIWLLMIMSLDLASIICSFVFYGTQGGNRALASAVIMTVVFCSHCVILIAFYFYSTKDSKVACDDCVPCVLYYAGTTVLVSTLGFMQIGAAIC